MLLLVIFAVNFNLLPLFQFAPPYVNELIAVLSVIVNDTVDAVTAVQTIVVEFVATKVGATQSCPPTALIMLVLISFVSRTPSTINSFVTRAFEITTFAILPLVADNTGVVNVLVFVVELYSTFTRPDLPRFTFPPSLFIYKSAVVVPLPLPYISLLSISI